jgi:hypothetical protein
MAHVGPQSHENKQTNTDVTTYWYVYS